jgi:hypothetical protein
MPSRIAPGGRRDVGVFAWAFAPLAGRVARSNPPNLTLRAQPDVATSRREST